MWGLGDVDLGQLEPDSCQYVAGYVTKKMTAKDDVRLGGRYPEFARMSLRPGLGHSALHEIADALMRYDLEKTQIDVPKELRHGPKKMPMGRYLSRSLRLLVGMDAAAPQEVLDQIKEELRPVREAAFNASESFAGRLSRESRQARKNLETRQKIYKQRKTI